MTVLWRFEESAIRVKGQFYEGSMTAVRLFCNRLFVKGSPIVEFLPTPEKQRILCRVGV